MPTLTNTDLREIERLRKTEGRTLKDLAEQYGVPIGTLKSYLHRAKKTSAWNDMMDVSHETTAPHVDPRPDPQVSDRYSPRILKSIDDRLKLTNELLERLLAKKVAPGGGVWVQKGVEDGERVGGSLAPTRGRIGGVLGDGRARTYGELAEASGLTVSQVRRCINRNPSKFQKIENLLELKKIKLRN